MSVTAIADDVRTIFITPLLSCRLDAVVPKNGRLREIILERERRDPGMQKSNYGGWHSSADLMNWEFPETRALAQEFLRVGREFTRATLPPDAPGEVRTEFYGGCWANVLRDGGYNTIHNHPGAVWSGVYYVATGEAATEPRYAGWIEFLDPRPGNIHAVKERVKPEAGMLLMWPSWLHHYVNPFRGKGERISVAFNLMAELVVTQKRPASAPTATVRMPS
jgi:uncharacterized protein (TIGR02466 family)